MNVLSCPTPVVKWHFKIETGRNKGSAPSHAATMAILQTLKYFKDLLLLQLLQ